MVKFYLAFGFHAVVKAFEEFESFSMSLLVEYKDFLTRPVRMVSEHGV